SARLTSTGPSGTQVRCLTRPVCPVPAAHRAARLPNPHPHSPPRRPPSTEVAAPEGTRAPYGVTLKGRGWRLKGHGRVRGAPDRTRAVRGDAGGVRRVPKTATRLLVAGVADGTFREFDARPDAYAVAEFVARPHDRAVADDRVVDHRARAYPCAPAHDRVGDHGAGFDHGVLAQHRAGHGGARPDHRTGAHG